VVIFFVGQNVAFFQRKIDCFSWRFSMGKKKVFLKKGAKPTGGYPEAETMQSAQLFFCTSPVTLNIP